MFGKKEKEPTYIDSREVKHSKSKLWLWILWLLILVRYAPSCCICCCAVEMCCDCMSERRA